MRRTHPAIALLAFLLWFPAAGGVLAESLLYYDPATSGECEPAIEDWFDSHSVRFMPEAFGMQEEFYVLRVFAGTTADLGTVPMRIVAVSPDAAMDTLYAGTVTFTAAGWDTFDLDFPVSIRPVWMSTGDPGMEFRVEFDARTFGSPFLTSLDSAAYNHAYEDPKRNRVLTSSGWADFGCEVAIGVLTGPPTGTGETPPGVPAGFSLDQNHPNPFNPSTSISFTLGDLAPVLLTVYDARGHLLATLIDQPLHPGRHEVLWRADGRPSGVYFYQIQKGPLTARKKMLLAK